MDELVSMFCLLAVMGGVFQFLSGCQEENIQARLIANKEFCIKAVTAGQKFEKCYDVVEKK